jgi:hypothetical protein
MAQPVNRVTAAPDEPAGQFRTSFATAALVDSNLNADEVINIKRLPSVAELRAVAKANGFVVEKIVLGSARITAVYKNTSNQSHTVCYQFPQEASRPPQPTVPTVAAVVPVPAPAYVIPTAISPEVVPADGYPNYVMPVYYPGYYPWFSGRGIDAYSRYRFHGYRGYDGGINRTGPYGAGNNRSGPNNGGSRRGGSPAVPRRF